MASLRPKMGCLVVLCLLALFGLAWAQLSPVFHSSTAKSAAKHLRRPRHLYYNAARQ